MKSMTVSSWGKTKSFDHNSTSLSDESRQSERKAKMLHNVGT